MGLKTSATGIALIKKFEGCPKNKKGQIVAYQDIGGVWTIGYGWTGKVNGNPITKNMTITQKEADDLLKNNLKSYEAKVNKYDSIYKWNQNQFDALVSFCWNIGSIDKLTTNGTRSISEISKAMLSYNKVNGKEVTGLTNRRKQEKSLFDKKVPSPTVYVKVNTNGSNLNCRKDPKIIIPSKANKYATNITGVFSNGTRLTLVEKTNKSFWKVKGKCTKGTTIIGYCATEHLKLI